MSTLEAWMRGYTRFIVMDDYTGTAKTFRRYSAANAEIARIRKHAYRMLGYHIIKGWISLHTRMGIGLDIDAGR